MLSQPIIVTVDGPSGVGKGTLSFLLAKKLGFNLLDSGAIYRALALEAIEKNLNLTDEGALTLLANNLKVEFVLADDEIKVLSNSQDVSTQLRTEQIGSIASKIAVLPKIRQALLEMQRSFAHDASLRSEHDTLIGLIADGRDMGTVIFPDAQVKIFLGASAEQRAERRFKQLQDRGLDAKYDEILDEIQVRDAMDRNRIVAPLKAADDALGIDSSDMSIDEVLSKALEFIESKL